MSIMKKKYEAETQDLITNDNGEKYPVSLNSEQARQLIEIDARINFPKKKYMGISQKPKGMFKLEITDLDASILVLDEARRQEFITFNNTGKAKYDIEINDYKVPFTLVLDPTVITDLKKNLSDLQEGENIVTMKYKIQASQNGKTYYTTDPLCLRLEIQKTDPRPIVRLELEERSVQFDPSCNEKIEIGKIKIKHSLPLHCAPELQATFKFNAEYGDTKLNRAIFLDEGDEVHETNPYIDEQNANIRVHGENPTALDYKLRQTDNQQTEYTLRHIKGRKGGNEISIPVYLDMQFLQNPKEDEQSIELSIVGTYQATETGNAVTGSISASQTFTLQKNKQVNKLEVECDDNLCENNEIYNRGRIDLNPGFTNDFVLTLRNAATVADPNNPDAGIKISNFRTTELAYDKKRLQLVNGLDAEQYFRFAPATIEEAMLRPTQDMEQNQTSLILSIKSDDIADIVKDDMQGFTLPMELTYEFDYIEGVNTDNNIEGYGQEKHFKGHIRWELSKPANPEWLSVDFGTSAIVATFARLLNQNNPDTNLLDLKAKKEELLKRTYKTDTARREDEQPEPAPFIPSDICYNSTNDGPYDAERTDDDFKTYPLWLSPTTGMADIKLPCLKSLIGNQALPDILSKQEQNAFRYKELQDGNETEVGLFRPDKQPNQLAKIDIILECVYKQLFKHYICQSNPEGQDGAIEYGQVNKLALSVPNTFTPKHHAQLRELAQRIFPNLYPEYLQVVSESDAVACYYIYNRYKFFQNTDGLIDNNRKQELDSKEHVLVFDMGAGTLDLTYFIKQTTPQGVTIIDMQGKLGVSKAGNYLDYLLAEILYDFLEANEYEAANDFRKWMELDKTTRERQNTPKKHCEALKDYVKNQVKPLLNDPNKYIPDANIGEHKITFTSKEDGTKLTVKDIKQNEKFRQYIKECTEETLDNLVALFGEQPQGIMQQNAPQLDIDVLIFSGRSSTLNDIREAVAKCIEKYCSHDILYADLTSTTLSGSPLLQTNSTESKPLKTAVSFGALLYADWINRTGAYQFKGRKIFAQYGALIHSTTNTWDWIPLIDCHTPQQNRPNPIAGKAPVWFSGATQTNLQTAQEILFVQSYSKQTLNDWENGKRDMISEMGSYYVQGNMGRCNIGIEIDANNVIKFYIGNSYISCYPSDDFKNTSLRKSLWPVVFN